MNTIVLNYNYQLDNTYKIDNLKNNKYKCVINYYKQVQQIKKYTLLGKFNINTYRQIITKYIVLS